MRLDDPHAPDPDPDLIAAAQAPKVGEDDIDDASYRSGLPGILGVLDTAVARIEAVLLAVGVMAMAVNTMANVVGRFALGRSIYFSEELNSAIIVLITFAGISYAARHGRHIRMSAFFDAMPFRSRKALMIVMSAITGALMLMLAWYALTYVITQAGRGRLLPAMGIPLWWILVWVPLGFFLTGVQYLLTAIKNVIAPDIWLSTSVIEGTDDKGEEV